MTYPPHARQHATYGAIFGRIITDKRLAAGAEQGEVAKALGVSQPTYSRIERGEVSVTLDMLARIAAYFGKTPSALLRDADNAASALRNMGIEVITQPPRTNDIILTLLGGAALSALLATALAKK